VKRELLATCRKTGEIGTRATLACRIDDQFGLWLSLVERLVRDQEAVGSNPTSPIIFVRKIFSRFLVLVLLVVRMTDIKRISSKRQSLEERPA
jgi:hypothetical protein